MIHLYGKSNKEKLLNQLGYDKEDIINPEEVQLQYSLQSLFPYLKLPQADCQTALVFHLFSAKTPLILPFNYFKLRQHQ